MEFLEGKKKKKMRRAFLRRRRRALEPFFKPEVRLERVGKYFSVGGKIFGRLNSRPGHTRVYP